MRHCSGRPDQPGSDDQYTPTRVIPDWGAPEGKHETGSFPKIGALLPPFVRRGAHTHSLSGPRCGIGATGYGWGMACRPRILWPNGDDKYCGKYAATYADILSSSCSQLALRSWSDRPAPSCSAPPFVAMLPCTPKETCPSWSMPF